MEKQWEVASHPKVWHPKSIEEAWTLKQTLCADGVFVAGGTLLRTQWENGIAPFPAHLINVSGIRACHELSFSPEVLILGSGMPLQYARENERIKRHLPLLTEALRSVAAPAVRRLATIGGNIASRLGDALPALLVYDADLIWYDGAKERREKLSDWLRLSESAKPPEARLLIRVELPLGHPPLADGETRAGEQAFQPEISVYTKVGRREGFTPSVVTIALLGRVSASGHIERLHVAAGGGQTVPLRLEAVERACRGEKLDRRLAEEVYAQVLEEFQPCGDRFASADYRKRTAANLIAAELWRACKAHDEERE